MEDAVERDDHSLPGSSRQPNDVRFVFTLIHGTWAKKARWVRPHSNLSRALKELPGGARVLPFVWTGRNSSAARRLASERLEKKLALRVQNYPAARHYVIAHSHGGNIAISTLARAPFKGRIAGAVCLSTPFLTARPRDLRGDPGNLIWGGVVLPLLSVTFLVSRLFTGLWAVFLSMAVCAVGLSTSVILKSWLKDSDKLLEDFESPKFDRDRILIIRSPGDEASSALNSVQLIARLTVGVFMRLMDCYRRLETRAKRWSKQTTKLLAVFASSFVVGALLLVSVANVNSPLQSAIVTTGSIVNALVFLEAFLLLLEAPLGSAKLATIGPKIIVSAFVWPVMFMLSVLLLPFGWEVAKANILLDVTAETTPVGSWMVHLVETPTTQELVRDTPSLIHSVAYESPRVLKVISDWVTCHDTDPCATPAIFKKQSA
jgi:hypothetical protein